MNKTRLEAFSDGVFAIIITIMVLELRAPESVQWEAIRHLVPVFFGYLLSFIYIAIYWGNHHHLMHTAKKVNAGIIWANMHLLFWLSLIPFATGWMGVNNFERTTVAVYGALLLICGIAYTILSAVIRKGYKEETKLSKALAKDSFKGWASVIMYSAAIPLALYVNPLISAALYVSVSIIWIIPSRNIQQAFDEEHL